MFHRPLFFTQIAYGDFTADGPTQTAFICPELTLRQVKRRASRRTLPPETVGAVCPALRGLGGREHVKNLIMLNTGGGSGWPHTQLLQIAGEEAKWKSGSGKRRREEVKAPAGSVSEFCGVGSAPTISWKFTPLPEGRWESGRKAGQVEAVMARQERQK